MKERNEKNKKETGQCKYSHKYLDLRIIKSNKSSSCPEDFSEYVGAKTINEKIRAKFRIGANSPTISLENRRALDERIS
jgi:hypothetical protein